jgi:hypothetical protein
MEAEYIVASEAAKGMDQKICFWVGCGP